MQHVANYKTTLFYEMRINDMLETMRDKMTPEVRQELEMMVSNPNTEAFQNWLSSKAVR